MNLSICSEMAAEAYIHTSTPCELQTIVKYDGQIAHPSSHHTTDEFVKIVQKHDRVHLLKIGQCWDVWMNLGRACTMYMANGQMLDHIQIIQAQMTIWSLSYSQTMCNFFFTGKYAECQVDMIDGCIGRRFRHSVQTPDSAKKTHSPRTQKNSNI